jgi:outer membrane protein assembly factor BamB
VQGDRVWLTTAIATQPTPEQIEAQFKQSQLDREKFTRRQVAGSVSLRLMSFNRNSGEVLLDTELAFVENPEAIHVGNSHASPTPFIEGDRLFVHFGIYGTFCLDRDTHRVIWRRSIPVFYSVGVGSSPVLCNGLLVLVCDGIDEQFVIALDKHTGETTW